MRKDIEEESKWIKDTKLQFTNTSDVSNHRKQ
uniref:Uncharacterized protein n=1 Tax=Rhizophora mucronata TaxID=61149 RepID=A0A2P2QHP4_RHIMU